MARVPRWVHFGIAVAAVSLGFSPVLWDLAVFAAHSALYSYILIVPFVSGYLVWLKRMRVPTTVTPVTGIAGIFGGLACALMVGYAGLRLTGFSPVSEDVFALLVPAYVATIIGFGAYFLGRETIAVLAFPFGFLFFISPLPVSVTVFFEFLLQQGSVLVALAFFHLAGTPVFNTGSVFELPGINIQVAPECSGIHSSVVLFITSLVAAHLFLRSTVRRVILLLLIIPLALLRNGFRVFVIGELCVHLGPEMINSYIHRRGGPIFFALSLIPLLVALYGLVRSEHAADQRVRGDQHPV